MAPSADCQNTLIARTGYTGEDGFEIYVPSDVRHQRTSVERSVDAGKEFGMIPCGLGARNTLRLESKMALYGHEISDTINVWEAGLDRYCQLEKGDFIGRAALEKARPPDSRALSWAWKWWNEASLAMGIAASTKRANPIGVITSGSPSPTLCKNIALAYVPPAYAALGTPIYRGSSFAEMQSAGSRNTIL